MKPNETKSISKKKKKKKINGTENRSNKQEVRSKTENKIK